MAGGGRRWRAYLEEIGGQSAIVGCGALLVDFLEVHQFGVFLAKKCLLVIFWQKSTNLVILGNFICKKAPIWGFLVIFWQKMPIWQFMGEFGANPINFLEEAVE